jgi:hypothetical protein
LQADSERFLAILPTMPARGKGRPRKGQEQLMPAIKLLPPVNIMPGIKVTAHSWLWVVLSLKVAGRHHFPWHQAQYEMRLLLDVCGCRRISTSMP